MAAPAAALPPTIAADFFFDRFRTTYRGDDDVRVYRRTTRRCATGSISIWWAPGDVDATNGTPETGADALVAGVAKFC